MWIGIFTVAWYVSDWEQMLIAWRRRRLEALRDSRVCLHCGYDLRATPKRCPECGRRTDEPIEV
jgi:rubrerythrin